MVKHKEIEKKDIFIKNIIVFDFQVKLLRIDLPDLFSRDMLISEGQKVEIF